MEQDFYFAFLRHGSYQQIANTPSAHQPYGLDPQGIVQCVSAAQTLKNFIEENALAIPSTIYSSNLLRAWQTANEIRQHLPWSLQISSTAQLNERSVGALANLTLAQIDQILRDDPRFEHPGFAWKSDAYYQLPFDGAESLMQAGQRVADCILQKTRATEQSNQLTVFVGHGASFRHAAYHLGILQEDDILQLSMHYAHPLFFKWNAQEQTFSHVAGDWKKRNHTHGHNNHFRVFQPLNNQEMHSQVMQWID